MNITEEYDFSDEMFVDNDTIVSILPLDENSLDLSEHPSIELAQEECDNLKEDNYVEIVFDEELKKPVLEIYGPETRLVFNCTSVLRYLVLFVKNLNRFFEFEYNLLS